MRAKVLCLFFAGCVLLANAPLATSQQPDWQKHIDWCIGDTGVIECPQDVIYPECLQQGTIAGKKGGRACLLEKGIRSAKDKDCDNAFRQAKVCQCHNKPAQEQINGAGKQAVCDYLKSKP